MTPETSMLAEIERLTRELERSRQEITRLSADLDVGVQERTAQLVATNQALIAANATADKANQAKWAVLWNMSHELHSPFNAMLGFGKILASGSPPTTAEQKKEFMAHIVDAGEQLQALIDEVLDLARVESGT